MAVAETAEDALADAPKIIPSTVAIVEYHLGGRNGVWVSRKLKRLQEPPQVVIYSAYASGHLAASCVIAEPTGWSARAASGLNCARRDPGRRGRSKEAPPVSVLPPPRTARPST